MLKVALVTAPLVPTLADPSLVAPSKKSTLPLGGATAMAPVGAVMEAVKVTCWPNTEGLTDEVRVVVVDALFTVCDRLPVLTLSWASPLYTAVMGWDPGG